MHRKFKDLSDADGFAVCKNNRNDNLTNPCLHCPAYRQVQKTQFACLFRMRAFVRAYMDYFIDDGSISDDELQWWQK